MVFLRELLAILVYITAWASMSSLFVKAFSWERLAVFFILLLVSYFLWPSKKRGARQENTWFLEVMFEFLIEFPVDVLRGLLSFLARVIFRSSDMDDFIE